MPVTMIYDRDGYDMSGHDRNGYSRLGYSRLGYDRDGYDRDEYDRNGFHRNGYDRAGYDLAGYDRAGFHRNGYDRNGYNVSGYNRDGYNVSGYNRDGVLMPIGQVPDTVAAPEATVPVVPEEEEEPTETCYSCDGEFDVAETTIGHDGERRCDSCHSERHFTCYSCDDECSVDDRTSHNGNDYCDPCFEQLFRDCGCCGRTVNRSSIDEDGNCCRCHVDHENDDDDDHDHSGSRRAQITVPVVADAGCLTNRCFAVELECYTPRMNDDRFYQFTHKGWQVTDDGSLERSRGGREFISGPRGGDKGVKDIEEGCKMLSEDGASVDTTCGMHVHLDATKETGEAVAKFMRLGKKLENWAFSVVPKSRRGNHYCRRLSSDLAGVKDESTLEDAVYPDGASANEKREKYHDARYSWINAHSWFYRGTVEVRLHPGTIHSKKVINWTRFWLHAFEFAKSSTLAEIDALPSDNSAGYVLAEKIKLPSDLCDYFAKRASRFSVDRAVEPHEDEPEEVIEPIVDRNTARDQMDRIDRLRREFQEHSERIREQQLAETPAF